MARAPDERLDGNDPGDDVALRFQYQHCYAAIHAIRLILPDTQFEEVICENHEDILVRCADGSFIAVQVKTRDLGQLAFKAGDRQILGALGRFACLEAEFPDSFNVYEFLTNHVFWTQDETENNLPYLLGLLKARGHVKRLRRKHPLRAFVGKICDSSGATEQQVETALLKCKINSKQDSIQSSKKDVLEALAECPGMGLVPYGTLRRIAKALIELAREASTKSHGASVLSLYEAGADLGQVIEHEQLKSKRIRKADVEAIIADCLADQHNFETLGSKDTAVDELPSTLSTLYQKLERGHLQTERVQQMEDLVRSTEALYFKWAGRFGAEEANRRMHHLRSVAQFECTEAKVAASVNGEPYASMMYSELYTRLVERCGASEEKVFNCQPEHLLGAAGALTEECKVWWSETFDLVKGDVT